MKLEQLHLMDEDRSNNSIIIKKDLIKIAEDQQMCDQHGMRICATRSGGEFDKVAVWFNSAYDWAFGVDSMGELIAVPTKK